MHPVRAVNFVLKNSVEYRVLEVLEEKLAVIFKSLELIKPATCSTLLRQVAWLTKCMLRQFSTPIRLRIGGERGPPFTGTSARGTKYGILARTLET
jgi:hypothetical protein